MEEVRSVLLVIDMQNDFVDPAGVCCVKGAAQTVPAINRTADIFRKHGQPVFFIVRRHNSDGSDAERFRRKLFDPESGRGVCVRDTWGAEIVPDLKIQEGDVIFEKTRFSAFFGTDLHAEIQKRGAVRVFVCGTQYPNCVRGTAVDALALDYDTFVVSDASSAQTEQIAEANLFDMRNMQIGVCTSETVEDLL